MQTTEETPVKEWTRHAPGVLSKIRKRDGERIYFAQVSWKGKRYTEKAGRTERQATKLLGQRQTEVDNGTYIPPKDRKKLARKATSDRESLRFDRAADSFEKQCSSEYSRPKDITSMVKHLKLGFGECYLDELIRADVDAYVAARIAHDGPFKKLTRKTGLRSPQREVALLSQIFGFMQDGGAAIENPCLRQRGRGRVKKSKAFTYTPEREAVVPSSGTIGAILTAPVPWLTAEHRALFTLAYYTGGRPESDLLRLRQGDVEIPEDNVVGLDGKPVLGWAHFRDAKTTAGNRDVPLHPEAAKALRALTLPEPRDEARRTAWAETHVFRTHDKEGKPRAWDRNSYRKAWLKAVDTVVEKFPGARGMILRDMRKVFRTRLTDARIPEPTIQILMGHARGVSAGYHKPDAAQLRDAILSIPVPPTPATEAVQVASRVAVDRVNAVNG
jgi:integrase